MDPITVKELLDNTPQPFGELRAGENGVGNSVKGVTVLEVSWIQIPEGQQFGCEDDLVITSMYSVRKSIEDQIETLRLLAQSRASALVLCHLGMVMKNLPEEITEECNKLNLPLIIARPDISYQEIIQNVYSAIQERRGDNIVYITPISDADLLKHRRALEGEYVETLIGGYEAHEQMIMNRSRILKHDIEHVLTVIVVDIYGFHSIVRQKNELEVRAYRENYARLIRDKVQLLSPSSVGCNTGDKYIILYTDRSPKEKAEHNILALCSELKEHLWNSGQIPVTIGIGTWTENIQDVHVSYKTALSSIRISNRLYRAPRLADYREFQVFLFLKDVISENSIKRSTQLQQSLLEPIVTYDQKHHADLEATFISLMRNNFNATTAAGELFIHKNTVLQRKQKIIELLGKDPFNTIGLIQFGVLDILTTT